MPTTSAPNPPEQWVLLWSHSQNCTHIEPLSRMLDTNCRAYAHNRPMDYVAIYVGDKDVAHAMSSSMRQTIIRRDEERARRGVH